ncbi:hypothetical protein BX666DRAFT_2110418, partial [Dichotomocladium elegans]
MVMTIPVVWPLLVLLCYRNVAWGFSSNLASTALVKAAVKGSELVGRFSGVYTGNTPYYGIPVGSANVTVPLITQRDIALNETIDHWLWPTINLSTAYFGNDYSSQKIAQVSEIMAMGYQRLVVDLFWDTGRRQWQLCPISTADNGGTSSSYTCSSSSSPFRELLETVNEQFLTMNLTISPAQVNLYVLILNLHSLRSNTADKGAAAEGMLEDALVDVIGRHRLYTPRELDEYRQNRSADSWPTWIKLIKDEVQLLVGLGTNDVPASEYKISGDLHTIFDVGELLHIHNQTASPSTMLELPCSYTNASWATMSDSQNDRFNYSTTLEAVKCGYSPYFTASNYSDRNTSHIPDDNDDPQQLADNILGTIWSWDVNEPRSIVDPHCAMIQRWNGRWRSGDCTLLLRVACRHQDDPNEYTFDCPRIATQNQRLYEALQNDLAEQGKNDPGNDEELHNLFWINLNTGSSGYCWVVGLYSTCWWLLD